MDIDERFRLIKEVGEEIIDEDELRALLKEKAHPVAYDGFEPSGRIHIAQGLLRAINVNKLTKAGIRFKFWVADWFALMNNKMGSDLAKIRTVGEYFIEVWKACGMDLKNVEFLWASEHMDQEYWLRVVRIGTMNSVQRVTRCSQIMGRSEGESLSAAQIFYPCMQASDIFHLKVDIAQLGMDQRKVNVLAREIAPKLGEKKPIAVHHHMLMGLTPPPAVSGQENGSRSEVSSADMQIAKKMSKSKPDSAIFMTDSEDEIARKFKKAYCPEGTTHDNPVLEYYRYILFEKFDAITIERPEKYGGSLTFTAYNDLERAFVKKEIHPLDLKVTAAKKVNELLVPVRKHFAEDKKARELLDRVTGFATTR